MLPKLNLTFLITSLISIIALLLVTPIVFRPTNAVQCPFDPPAPQLIITNPPPGVVSGTVDINILGEELSDKVRIMIRHDELGWQQIYEGGPKDIYKWDTTAHQNSDYCLKAFAENNQGGSSSFKESQNVIVTINNSQQEPPNQDPPPSGDDNGNQGSSSQPSSNQETSNQSTTQTTTSTNDTKEKDNGKVEKALIEEEIPISISTFDPDIFLKGSNVTINQIKNVSKVGQQLLHFEGKTLPNTLVTLYVFSNPVIVVVKSDSSGRWAYDRERNLDSGKHTAFATIYDDGITRRSRTVDFFIASSAQGSLILQKNNLQRLYPYAIALGGSLAIAILILFMYRIYSKRKQTS